MKTGELIALLSESQSSFHGMFSHYFPILFSCELTWGSWNLLLYDRVANVLIHKQITILYQSGRMLEKADHLLHSSAPGAFVSLMFK